MFLSYNGEQYWPNDLTLKSDLILHLGREQGEKTFKKLQKVIPIWATARID